MIEPNRRGWLRAAADRATAERRPRLRWAFGVSRLDAPGLCAHNQTYPCPECLRIQEGQE